MQVSDIVSRSVPGRAIQALQRQSGFWEQNSPNIPNFTKGTTGMLPVLRKEETDLKALVITSFNAAY